MLLTVMGWKAILFIFGYADFIVACVAIVIYLKHKKNKTSKIRYYDFIFRGALPILIIQGISISIFYILNSH
jgi:hypothetical protein